MVQRRRLTDERGQATVEYILLLSITVFFFMALFNLFNKIHLAKILGESLMDPYRRTFQWGHPKAEGFEKGPKFHPRAPSDGNQNFRIFINPGTPSEGDG